MERYAAAVEGYIAENWRKLLRSPSGILRHPFLVPGDCYDNSLWDWDSWLTDVAITPVAEKMGLLSWLFPYQQGCIRNFCDHMDPETGWMPIMIDTRRYLPEKARAGETNSAKPVLVQHGLFIAKAQRDVQWLRPLYPAFQKYLNYYRNTCLHESGLFYFQDDACIGVDNDPCTFYRPKGSSASIFLNSLMYRELLAMEELSRLLEYPSQCYAAQAEALKQAIQSRCYDERNGFYYSVDIDLLPVDPNQWLHSGCPRNWDTLMRRIDVWSGFLPMWAGIPEPEQAKRMVEENFRNRRTFRGKWGVRTLSKCEKMYQIVGSGNPSCWLGPLWGISNYMVWRGLVDYGYLEDARELACQTVEMFGRDIEACGRMHEYYHPETGQGVHNPGFQSWNLLCGHMIHWLRSL